jgi:hypothetical protein
MSSSPALAQCRTQRLNRVESAPAIFGSSGRKILSAVHMRPAGSMPPKHTQDSRNTVLILTRIDLFIYDVSQVAHSLYRDFPT